MFPQELLGFLWFSPLIHPAKPLADPVYMSVDSNCRETVTVDENTGSCFRTDSVKLDQLLHGAWNNSSVLLQDFF